MRLVELSFGVGAAVADVVTDATGAAGFGVALGDVANVIFELELVFQHLDNHLDDSSLDDKILLVMDFVVGLLNFNKIRRKFTGSGLEVTGSSLKMTGSGLKMTCIS